MTPAPAISTNWKELPQQTKFSGKQIPILPIGMLYIEPPSNLSTHALARSPVRHHASPSIPNSRKQIQLTPGEFPIGSFTKGLGGYRWYARCSHAL